MKKLGIVVLIVSLSGCAGANYRPLIDTSGVDMNRHEADLKACQQYAAQVNGAGETAAAGAVIGALFGFALAAVAGRGYDRGATGRVGALAGGVSGGAQGETDQRQVVKNCMQQRGYRVLH